MAWATLYCPDFRAVSTVGAVAGTTASNDRRLMQNLVGTPTFVLDSIDVGRYAIRCDSTTATNQRIGLATLQSTTRYVGGVFRFKVVNATLASNILLAGIGAGTSTNSVWLRIATTGELQYTFGGSAGTFTGSGVFIATQNVYQMEFFVDFNTGTTHTLKVRLNGTEVINVTGGTAIDSAGATGLFLGSDIASVTDSIIDFSDIATYNDVAQYATVNDLRVCGLEPVSDGTHSFTANDFQDDASTNLTTSTTTSWDKVNDAPSAAATSVTDFVKQVVVRTTGYMEWVIRSLTTKPQITPSAPVLVSLVAAMHPVAAATANTVAFRLNSNGNVSAEAAIDTSTAADTIEYRQHFYATEPSTAAAWTLSMVQGTLRARFGYSSDIAPPPACDAIMAFVAVPVTPVGLPPIQPVVNTDPGNTVHQSVQVWMNN